MSSDENWCEETFEFLWKAKFLFTCCYFHARNSFQTFALNLSFKLKFNKIQQKPSSRLLEKLFTIERFESLMMGKFLEVLRTSFTKSALEALKITKALEISQKRFLFMFLWTLELFHKKTNAEPKNLQLCKNVKLSRSEEFFVIWVYEIHFAKRRNDKLCIPFSLQAFRASLIELHSCDEQKENPKIKFSTNKKKEKWNFHKEKRCWKKVEKTYLNITPGPTNDALNVAN